MLSWLFSCTGSNESWPSITKYNLQGIPAGQYTVDIRSIQLPGLAHLYTAGLFCLVCKGTLSSRLWAVNQTEIEFVVTDHEL